MLNEGEEECARMMDGGSGEIDSWSVRGDLVIHSQNKENWVVSDEETVTAGSLVDLQDFSTSREVDVRRS